MRTAGTWSSITDIAQGKRPRSRDRADSKRASCLVVMGLLGLPFVRSRTRPAENAAIGVLRRRALESEGHCRQRYLRIQLRRQGLYTAGLLNKPKVSRHVLDAWRRRKREKLARQ